MSNIWEVSNKIDIPIYQNLKKIRFLGTSSIISQYSLYRVAQKTVLSGYKIVIIMFINLKINGSVSLSDNSLNSYSFLPSYRCYGSCGCCLMLQVVISSSIRDMPKCTVLVRKGIGLVSSIKQYFRIFSFQM